jgi:flavin reductase (DIM6/NTAB) family NADH-FMN oxidoreductase RutF
LAGGFTAGKAETVNAPAIEESFLTLECELAEARDLFLGSRTVLILGKAKRAVLEDSHAHRADKKYGPEGFMFNIHSPIDLKTGEGEVSAVATMKIEKLV